MQRWFIIDVIKYVINVCEIQLNRLSKSSDTEQISG